MEKLLVICGPTATGKTKLAIYLAKKLNGEIVSADSRQVYRGLDIGTGKELPGNSQLSILLPRGKAGNSQLGGYYEIEGVKIWGYDIVGPREKFSVAQYENFANKIITRIQKDDKLPILVGGTGFYIKAAVEGIPTANIPRNENLRKNLESKSADELFGCLAQIDPVKAASLNLSDKINPRRLVRAIEIAQWESINGKTPGVQSYSTPGVKQVWTPVLSVLFVGLTAPKGVLDQLINKRVDLRIKNGIEGEIRDLLAKGVIWGDQSMSSLGYRPWKEYFESQSPSLRREVKVAAIEKWKTEEKKYAKRQLMWFKKDRRINWFDISAVNWQKEVEVNVQKWYNS